MRIIIVSLLLMMLSAGLLAQGNEKVFKLTKAANDSSLQGHIDRNVDRICAVYSEDAILLPPGGVEPIRGIESIKKYYLDGFKSGRILKAETENISYEVLRGGRAIEVGKYKLLYKAANDDKEIEIRGTMLIQWEKNKKGEWKIKLDMWH
jgi:ketosteroid isomerase-like protein